MRFSAACWGYSGIVAAMRSLAQVLHEAANRNASEIVLEPGEPPMIRTDAGSVAFGDVFAEGELFDALGQVLGPEQQAELAVGNVVEFHVDSGSSRWSLITEAGGQGIVVRGRCTTAKEENAVGVSLELPPLEHSEDADPVPSFRASVLARATRRTALDLAASPPASPDPVPVASDGRPSWLESNAGAGVESSNDESKGIDFALRDSDRPVDSIELPPDPQELGALLEGGDDQAEGASLAAHVRSVGPGTLCLVRREGRRGASELPGAVGIDDATPPDAFVTALERDPETTYALWLEDPGARLGWIMRRLEEGARVVVETRAKTFEGAYRMLVGLNASSETDAWLAAHRMCWLVSEGGAWILKSKSRGGGAA
jgi:hypothetical protein